MLDGHLHEGMLEVPGAAPHALAEDLGAVLGVPEDDPPLAEHRIGVPRCRSAHRRGRAGEVAEIEEARQREGARDPEKEKALLKRPERERPRAALPRRDVRPEGRVRGRRRHMPR